MTNRWIEFVKDFAKKNNLSYGCALSEPKLKEQYRAKYGSSKKISSKKERETMSMEDVNIKEIPKSESELMGAEDINVGLKKQKYTKAINKLRDRIVNSKTKEELKKNSKILNQLNEKYSDGELTDEDETNFQNLVEMYNKSLRSFKKSEKKSET